MGLRQRPHTFRRATDVVIRDLERSDIERLRAMHDDAFPFPDLSNPRYLIQKAIDVEGELIGSGIVRLTSEAILILDKTTPRVTRVKATQAIVNSLMRTAKLKGLDECHAFVREPNIERLLKTLGFENSKGGTPLFIDF